MRDTVSYDIRPWGNIYTVTYKRGWFSQWKAYKRNGKAREFTSYDDAAKWLAAKHTVGYVQLRLVK